MIPYKYIYLLFFLLNPARPINPEPNSSMVAGSGTGAADPSITSLAQVAATLGLIQIVLQKSCLE